jgi:phenylpropionate dioxygenase-like ring-hydroxylating dioxygenase large terminal subunit
MEISPMIGSVYEARRTLPSRCYTETGWLGLELERIFAQTWQFVGWVDALAAPGSSLTATVGRIPVVVG